MAEQSKGYDPWERKLNDPNVHTWSDDRPHSQAQRTDPTKPLYSTWRGENQTPPQVTLYKWGEKWRQNVHYDVPVKTIVSGTQESEAAKE